MKDDWDYTSIWILLNHDSHKMCKSLSHKRELWKRDRHLNDLILRHCKSGSSLFSTFFSQCDTHQIAFINLKKNLVQSLKNTLNGNPCFKEIVLIIISRGPILTTLPSWAANFSVLDSNSASTYGKTGAELASILSIWDPLAVGVSYISQNGSSSGFWVYSLGSYLLAGFLSIYSLGPFLLP